MPYTPSTRRQTGGQEVQDHPWLHSRLEASLGYTPHLETVTEVRAKLAYFSSDFIQNMVYERVFFIPTLSL